MAKIIVYKVTVQCTNIKFIYTTYNTREMVKKKSSRSHQSDLVIRYAFSSIYSEFSKSRTLCVVFCQVTLIKKVKVLIINKSAKVTCKISI